MSVHSTLALEVFAMPLQDADVKEITSRLDIMVKLLAAMYARDRNNNESIVKLDNMQLSREQITDSVGVTTHNVAQVLYASKKGETKSKKSEAAAPDAATVPAVMVGESEPQQ
jgi:hypothetical protein